MKTLAVISHKGGAGKTTTAVMLAEELAERGYRTLLIDADRQRAAGVLLGVSREQDHVQRTAHPRLRYYCSAELPVRELRGTAEELVGLFDVAVIDTPSLDDPLARGWIQLADAALPVLPVEPISLKTLAGVDASLDIVRTLNSRIAVLNLLPAMFRSDDPTQRALLRDLEARRSDRVFGAPVPYDPGILHRGEQVEEHRTSPSDECRDSYRSVADSVVREMALEDVYRVSAPRLGPEHAGSAGVDESGARVFADINGWMQDERLPGGELTLGTRTLRPRASWGLALAAVLALLLLAVGICCSTAVENPQADPARAARWGL